MQKLLAGSVALVWLLLAQPAFGATAWVSSFEGFPGVLRVNYQAALGEVNAVSIREEPEGVYTITDLNTTIVAQAGCASITPNTVRCELGLTEPRDPPLSRAWVLTKDGADSVYLTSSKGAYLQGGGGDDTLTTNNFGAWRFLALNGGLGDDRLIGGPGRQALIGGPGADSLDGGLGNDVLQGGYGDDVIRSGPGNDEAFGGGHDDFMSGGSGDDFLTGDFGADVVRGGTGNDLLGGAPGPDNLLGGRGRDRLSGGLGTDVLRAGPGSDRLSGGSGPDVLYARDRNRDTVRGNSGPDRAHVDPIDVLFNVEVLF
jgi:Ca2+-binding RTX toxin-like protein